VATREERENQEQINRLLSEANRFAEQEARNSSSRVDFARQLNSELRDQIGVRQRLSDQDTILRDIGKEVLKNAQQNFTELGNINKLENELTKARKTQLDITRELTSLSADLTQEQLANAEDISNLLMLQASEQEKITDLKEQQRLNDEGIISLSEDELRSLNNSIAAHQSRLNLIDEEVNTLAGVTEGLDSNTQAALGRVTALRTMQQLHNQNVATMANELQTQRNINDRMGVTGSLVEGIGGIMQRIGLRSGIFNDAMDKAKQTMHDLAEEAERTGKNISKAEIAGEGLRIIMEGVRKAMFDPLTLALALLDGFFDLNKAGVQFGQMTGQAADAMSGVHTEVSTAVDMLKTATSVTKELGLNAAAVFTPQQIGQISDMATLLGLSEQAAGRLGLMMKTTGQSADQLGESVYETVSGLNEAGRSAVAPRQVLDDVLTASEDIALSLGNNPDKLAAAATAARKFGMTLSQVDKIADSLLDFESSIEAELEAQLLTGKNINMAKARELALNNDLAGLAKELEKQGVSAVEFSKMNRIQQEATAKALGMSRQELSKSLLTQEAQANMTDEQLAAARGVSLEESKRIGIQERIEKAIQKVQLAFAPVLEALVPIVENALALINPFITVAGILGKALAVIVKFPPVLYTIQGIMAAIAAIQFKNFLTGGRSLEVLGRAARMNKKLTIGQTIALKAHLAIQKLVTGSKIKDTAAENLNTAARIKGNILERISIALGKTRLGQLVLEKAAILQSAAAKLFGANATAALNTQSRIAATTGAAGGAGMAAFAAGLTALSPAIPVILAIAAALLLAAPAIWATGQMVVGLAKVIGNVLIKALEMLPSIIASVATGFSMILSQLTLEKAAALVVMGAGFAAIGYGLTVLSASLLTALPGLVMLGAIAAMGPRLALAGQGVKLIADNVSKLSEALQTLNLENLDRLEEFMTKSALTMPIIAAAGPAAASVISTIAGAGGAGEEDNKVAAKIQELIDLVASGQIVELKLDSDTISRQQMLSMTKSK
jgi:hypothetical protein